MSKQSVGGSPPVPERLRFQRPKAAELARRLGEPRRYVQVVAGPRQVGKTTLALQVADQVTLPVRYATADEPTLRGPDWVASQWEAARLEAAGQPGVLILDEIQKAEGWAESVKRLWDEDSRHGRSLKVVLLGSAPLLIQRGLTESLAGRFEVLRVPHWSFPEMREAFGLTVDEFLWFGGYPGAAPLRFDELRWRRYVLDALVETTVARDLLLMTRVDKPALLRRLLELGCAYSGQILSYNKMLGQLQAAGNTTTLAHYLELLDGAGLVTGLSKYSGAHVRRRRSSPKLQVLNTALMTSQTGRTLDEARADQQWWGRLVESAVGAHLANASAAGLFELFYWRDGPEEVDFVVRRGATVLGIEVKSGRAGGRAAALGAFSRAFDGARILVVGGDGLPLEEFLCAPIEGWLGE